MRRHRTAVAAAVLVSASLVGGIVATTRQARLAQRRFDEARRLIRTVIFDIQPKMGAVAGTTALRKDLIESTLQYLEALSRDAGDNPALLRSWARPTCSWPAFGPSRATRTSATPRPLAAPSAKRRRSARGCWPWSPMAPDSLHEAVNVERNLALSSAVRRGRTRSPSSMRGGAIERAERAVAIRPDAQAREDLADAHRTLGNAAECLEAFARSREIYEALVAENPEEARGAAEPVPGPQVRGGPPSIARASTGAGWS